MRGWTYRQMMKRPEMRDHQGLLRTPSDACAQDRCARWTHHEDASLFELVFANRTLDLSFLALFPCHTQVCTFLVRTCLPAGLRAVYQRLSLNKSPSACPKYFPQFFFQGHPSPVTTHSGIGPNGKLFTLGRVFNLTYQKPHPSPGRAARTLNFFQVTPWHRYMSCALTS